MVLFSFFMVTKGLNVINCSFYNCCQCIIGYSLTQFIEECKIHESLWSIASPSRKNDVMETV